MARRRKVQGTVYLLHFTRPFKHAKHYLGWTSDLPARLDAHRTGAGSCLLRAVVAAGIGFDVVRTWKGDRAFERRLHQAKSTPRLCPVCSPTALRRIIAAKEEPKAHDQPRRGRARERAPDASDPTR